MAMTALANSSMDDHMNNTNMMMMNNTNMMMTMHMSFYWGKNAIILFSDWPKESLLMYLLCLLLIFILALAIEILSVLPAVTSNRKDSKLGVLIEAIVYGVRMGFAYMVMLSVMSYNIGIFIVAVFGHAVGFFIVKTYALALDNNNTQSETIPKV